MVFFVLKEFLLLELQCRDGWREGWGVKMWKLYLTGTGIAKRCFFERERKW
jgi:hypothetical protein